MLIFSMIFLSITILFCLIRGITGERFTDKILSVNVINVKVIILIMILGVYFERSYLIDIAMVYAVISFLSVVILSRIFLRDYMKKNTKIKKTKVVNPSMEIIRYIFSIIFLIGGLFVFGVATFGLFRFDYILNRAHVAAKCDTLASLLITIGLILYSGFNNTSLKLFIVLVFLWLTNPVATHLICETEVITNKDIDKTVR